MTQYHFFLIPLEGAGGAVEDLNRFLRGHRVVTVDRRLVERDGGPVWAFCVEYLESAVAGGGKSDIRIDYRELLPPEQFEKFSRLRVLRKQLAEKESVPPYAIFTNEQLAAMSALEQPTLETFRSIAGVGEAKTAKYGALFLQALQDGARSGGQSETSGQSTDAHRGA